MLKLNVAKNDDHLLLIYLNKNMHMLSIDDKSELLLDSFVKILKFDIVDYLIVMDHRAMFHFDVE